MADNKGTVIILAIVAVGALGLSGYMFTMDLLSEEPEYGDLRLVAFWDGLEENFDTPPFTTTDNFLVAYNTPIKLDTNYINVVNETRFNFVVAGIYRININVFLSPVVADEIYWVVLLQNKFFYENFERIGIENPATTTFYHSKGSVYVNVTGGLENYYEIQVYGGAGGIMSLENYNQLSIEYVLD